MKVFAFLLLLASATAFGTFGRPLTMKEVSPNFKMWKPFGTIIYFSFEDPAHEASL